MESVTFGPEEGISGTVAFTGARKDTFASMPELSRAVEAILGDWGSSGATVGTFSRVALCAPTAFGSKDGNIEVAAKGLALVSIGGDRGDGSIFGPDAEADKSSVELAPRAMLGIEAAIAGGFMLPGVSAATPVIPATGAKFAR